MKTRRGYSLAEVLIAIAVLSIGVAGVTASVVYGTRHADAGARLSESTEIARMLFEELQASTLIDTVQPGQPWPGPDSGLADGVGARVELGAAPFGALNFPPSYRATFKRRVTVEPLADEPRLARVTIEIFWSDPNGEHRTEFFGVTRHARG